MNRPELNTEPEGRDDGIRDREAIRQRLSNRREELVRKLHAGRQHLTPQSGANPDRSSLAQSYTSQQLRTRYFAKILREIEQLDSALVRLEQNIYGYCENCKNRIAPGRLEVLPQAKMCINCQSQLEQQV